MSCKTGSHKSVVAKVFPSRGLRLSALCLLSCVINIGSVDAAEKNIIARDIRPILQRFCFECHGEDTAEGDLNVAGTLKQWPLVKNLSTWTNVLAQIKNGVMPPEDAPQPTKAQREKLVGLLDQQINHFDYSGVDDPGYEPVRRLTNVQYQRTLNDLFGGKIEIDAEFPADLTGSSGFDNSANTLFLNPLLMERYFGAAEQAVDQAIPVTVETASQKKRLDFIIIAKPGNGLSEEDAARQVLHHFLERAFRRPVDESELNKAVEQFQKARQEGRDYARSIKQVIQTVLVSANFILRVEPKQDSTEKYRVDDWSLAGRLSYFLWSSMPDEQLFRLAKAKKLHDPKVLRQQVERMLLDERANSLGEIFASQWLGFQHLGTRVRLDPIDNPWCTDTLMAAMKEESAMFFNSIARENQPISRLIDAKYTFMNEELARHYGLEELVEESGDLPKDEMRRVELRDDRRGGIFGQGSLLAVTSFPGRTSPVVRGKWILADVLGTPPPPPPPNVSELPEEVRRKRRLSFREKLELHRDQPSCNSCHEQIDPLGFSLEHFDYFGRWRNRVRGHEVDDRGKLPNGTEFVGISGLRKVIIEQRLDDLLRQLTKKMLAYALGRQLEYYDEPAVRKIVAEVKRDDYRIQTLVSGIVTCYPFQYKKNRPPEDTQLQGGESR